MATINDRITKLEDAFITLAEGQREFAAILKGLVEGQREFAAILKGLAEGQNALVEGQNALVEGQNTLIEGQKAIIATLQDHSVELKLIREHLG